MSQNSANNRIIDQTQYLMKQRFCLIITQLNSLNTLKLNYITLKANLHKFSIVEDGDAVTLSASGSYFYWKCLERNA